jgi:uncharacterized membrane protein SpoIIM required for sporulation
MTPLQFEQRYKPEWRELESALESPRGRPQARLPGERIAWLYRRACEQLALARARSYPAHLTGHLEQLTAEAHQLIYQHTELGLGRLARFITVGFPRAVRAQGPYMRVALAVFGLPALVLGVLVYFRPELVLTMLDAREADEFEQMYSGSAEVLGRLRSAQTDWLMFGYYIRNNISVAFQCFAGGLLAGVGSLFYLVFNGLLMGAVAGYLTERGHAATFYSFIVTHSAFELTAIVLAGGAGLKLGAALLLPGRRRRLDSLVAGARDCVPIMYGVVALLLVAAAIEAFWSSARWLPLPVKYTVAAVCWIAVLFYLGRQGRGAHAG